MYGKGRLLAFSLAIIRPAEYPISYSQLLARTPARRRKHTSLDTLRQHDHSLRVFNDVHDLRALRAQLLKQDRTVGLVPTMGALHEGHISLMRTAAQENTDVFVSVFVNPTQFGPAEDLATYPRTWDADVAQMTRLNEELLESESLGKITGIFAPSVKTMYPTLPPSSEIDGDGSFVTVTPLSRKLEGASRPVFFRGVATVCTKLFNVVQPDRVYFGQKDVQQSVLIRRMVKDFLIPTTVRVIATSRESEGLALSSRNVYLGEKRRAVAPVLNAALKAAEDVYLSGEISRAKILAAAHAVVHGMQTQLETSPRSERALFEVVYISLADPDEMDEIVGVVDPARGAILSGAFRMLPVEEPCSEAEKAQNVVRLIDNIILRPR